jgi:hypothetical protein
MLLDAITLAQHPHAAASSLHS